MVLMDKEIQQAMQYCQNGEYDKAEVLCRKLIEQDASLHTVLHMLGVLNAQKGAYENAKGWFVEALAIKEDEALYHSSMGNVEKALEQKDSAKQHYLRALQLNPDYAEAHNNLAILLYREKAFTAARAHYTRAVHIKPDYLEAHFNLGLLFLKENNLDAATRQFLNVVRLNALSVAAHCELADIFLHQNNITKAIEHLEHVLAIDPDHIRALNNMGVAMLKQNKAMQAVNYFGEVLKRDKHNILARNNIAATFLEQDWYENAMHHYRELIQITPNDIEVNYNLAVSLMAQGQLEAAEEYFIKTIQLEPVHLEAHINLAAVLHKREKYDQAKLYYKAALRLKPHDPLCEYMLMAMGDDLPDAAMQQRAPTPYVTNLFDRYALHYDRHLTKSLSYQVPDQIVMLLAGKIRGHEAQWDILDLGCGTGLAGDRLQTFIGQRLVGVDLSSKMLAMAEKRKLYTELLTLDICNHELSDQLGMPFDLIVAADVFGYLGDLATIFKSCHTLSKPDGYFVFSIEKLEGEGPYQLLKTARFAHNIAYIESLADQCNFKCLQHKTIVGRRNDNQDVLFELFLLQRD